MAQKRNTVFFATDPLHDIQDAGLGKEEHFHQIPAFDEGQEKPRARLKIGMFPVTAEELLDPSTLEKRLLEHGFSLLEHPDSYLLGMVKGLKTKAISFSGAASEALPNQIIGIGKDFLSSQARNYVLSCQLRRPLYLGCLDRDLKKELFRYKGERIAVLVQKILL